MPEPFAHPRMRTGFPPMEHLAAAHFGTVSVVMMARATCSKALTSELSARARAGTAFRIFSTRSGVPITPVEQTRISRGGQPSARAILAAVERDAARPSGPVQQFALPELTMTARTFPRDSFKWALQTRTGAACTRFVVKMAAVLAGASLMMSARSSRDFFRPQCVAAKVKPRGTSAFESGALMRSETSWIFLELDEARFEVFESGANGSGSRSALRGVAREG